MNMFKPSRKKIQNTDIKKNGKINAQEELKWNQYDLYFFTEPTWALAGSPCFDFSFELR